jgi:hypothetical protein
VAAFGGWFGFAGYSITVRSLPPGAYQLAVSARSTVSGKFDTRIVPINVADVATIVVDSPSPNAVMPAGGELKDGPQTRGIQRPACSTRGRIRRGAGVHLRGVADYRIARPDIGARFRMACGLSFKLRLRSLRPGRKHTVAGVQHRLERFPAVAFVRVGVR